MRFSIHLSLAFLLVFSIAKAQNNFTRITCGGNITINIQQGDSCSYTANNSEKYETTKVIFEVYNNTLHIEGGNFKDATANVTVKELKGLNIDGVTRVNCLNTIKSEELKAEFNGATKASLNLEVKDLVLEANGAAQVDIEGTCNNGEIEINGAGKVNAKKCIFNTCRVEANGASTCSLDSVTGNLKVEALGASKIYVRNIPEVYVASRSGLGKIYEGKEGHDTTMHVDTKIVINDELDTEIARHHFFHDNHDAGFNWSGLNLGFNGLLNANNSLKAPAGYDFLDMNNASSLQFSLNLLEKDFCIYKHYIMGMTGAGFTWNNYKFTSPDVIQPYQQTLSATRDTGKVYKVNKLRVSYFNVPLLIGFNTSQKESKAFHVAAGVVVGLRMGGMVKTVTDNKDQNRTEKTFASFHTEQLRYDVMVRMKYKWANVWATYSLNGLFRKNEGPMVHPVAVGVNLLEF
jgi:hypothetical protein